ncbi:MAG TPA: FtsX-like permease family protein [Bacillus bacterium]|nr:FtsX-like permease family protein [Bacillus sp. (in: firmicutes)]
MLWRKMFGDIFENKFAYFACAVVIAIGLMAYTSMSIAKDGLFYAKDQFYQDYHFADGFAKVKAIPYTRAKTLEEISGINKVEGRLIKDVRVLMPDTKENVYLRLISLHRADGNKLNGIKLEKGTFPEEKRQQILVADKFYEAHGLQLGEKVNVIIEGKQVELSISGTGQSPEYIYALKELQSIAADPKTFEVAYMPYEDMEQLFNQKGLVNDISFTLRPEVNFVDVEQRVKSALEKYELESLCSAKDQLSNAMLTEELKQMERMASSLPVIFLVIAAIILYIMLKRLVESQRGQIGTLKAFGYRNLEILLHYMWYGVFIGVFGGLLGGLLGIWVSKYFLEIYQMYFSLPNLEAHTSLKYFYLGIIMAALFSAAASFQGVKSVIRLQPAEAMHPVVPTFVKKTKLEEIHWFWRMFNVQGRMAIRNLLRNKSRSFFTFIGIVFTFAMMASFFSFYSMAEVMIMDQFTKVQKQDVKWTFAKPMPRSDVIRELQHVTGMKHVEPLLEVPVSLRFLNHKKDVVALGITADSTLYNVFDKQGNRLELPKSGMMVSEQIADKLGVKVGDVLQMESMYAKDEKLNITVEKIIPQYLGANVYLNQDVLLALLKQGEMMTSALMAIDEKAIPDLKERYRSSKYVSTIEVRQEMIDKYTEMMAASSSAMWIMALISIITGFAIVYNSSIISLAERKRELASLRVMGMTPKEVMGVVSVEQWFLGFVGMIAGIPLAFSFCKLMSTSMSSDLYTIPAVINSDAIIQALIGTIVAIAISLLAVSRKVKQLDLVAVLKERE